MLGRRLDDSFAPEIRHGITAVTAGRLGSNAVSRYLGPFVATVAAGLDVSVSEIGVAIAVAEGCGIASPLLGGIVDRLTHRQSMTIGLATSAVGSLLLATSAELPGPAVVGFAGALVLFSLAKIFYDVALGAWIADLVPFARRGRIVGLTETSWALGLLVGVSLMGLVTSVADWRWAYAVGGVAIAALAVVNFVRLGGDGRHRGESPSADGGSDPTADAEPAAAEPAAADAPVTGAVDRAGRARIPRRGWLAIATMFGMCSAGQTLFLTFGAWLQDERGFSDAELSAVTFGLGALELCASSLSSARTDRWGKERSVLAGISVMVVAGTALAIHTGVGGAGAATGVGLVLVICFIAGFEFGIVSLLPLGGDLVAGRPGAGLGYFLAAVAAGRAVATIPTTRLFEGVGFWSCAVMAVGLSVVAAVALRLRHSTTTAAI